MALGLTCGQEIPGYRIEVYFHHGHEEPTRAGIEKNSWVRDERSKRHDGSCLGVDGSFRRLLQERIERLGGEKFAARVVNRDGVVDPLHNEAIADGQALIGRLEFTVYAVRAGEDEEGLVEFRQSLEAREGAAHNAVARRSGNLCGLHAGRSVVAVLARNVETHFGVDILADEMGCGSLGR